MVPDDSLVAVVAVVPVVVVEGNDEDVGYCYDYSDCVVVVVVGDVARAVVDTVGVYFDC